MVGTAVFRIVVSNDSINNATATSHGSSRLLEAANEVCEKAAPLGMFEFTFLALAASVAIRRRLKEASQCGWNYVRKFDTKTNPVQRNPTFELGMNRKNRGWM